MTDWLTLHGLSANSCERLLKLSSNFSHSGVLNRKEIYSLKHTMSAEEAWQLAAEALCAYFPDFRTIIENAKRTTRVDFRPDLKKYPRPFTLNNGGDGYPFISCNYRGLVADKVAIVHEFSHAVQIMASKSRFVTPVVREICAFTGELALQSLLQVTDPAIYRDVRLVWLSDNEKLFQKNLPDLQSALNMPLAHYNYQWNYPIARILTIECQRQLPRSEIWALFEGKTSMEDLRGLLEL